MQIERLDHLVLTVADIARTCEFYTRVLGMEVVRFGEGRTALRFGQQKINLHAAGGDSGSGGWKAAPGIRRSLLYNVGTAGRSDRPSRRLRCSDCGRAGTACRRGRDDTIGLYSRSGPQSDRDLELLRSL